MRYLQHFLFILVVTACGNLMAQSSQNDLEQLMRSRGEYYFTLTVSQPSEIPAVSDL